MTEEDMLKAQKTLTDAYYEGFNDCLYKTSEYLREVCWLQSMARAQRERIAEDYYNKDADK